MTSALDDPTPLQPNYLPSEIVDREEEYTAIDAVISDVPTNNPQNLHLHGPRCTGKTLLIHLALTDLPQKVNTCYIPATQYNTRYKSLQQLYHLTVDDQINDGYHTSDLQRRIENRFQTIPTVVVLDNIDFLLLNDGDDLLYYLSRIDTHENLCIITVSANTPDLSEKLEERTYSTLYPQTVDFEPYTSEQLFRILVDRAQKALTEQSLHRDAVHYIAATTSNASLALTWLETAAKEATDTITKHLVKQVQHQAFQTYAERLFDNFTEHHRLLFQAIQELSAEYDSQTIQAGVIYDRYQDLCETYSDDSLSNRRISDYLKHLELLNLVEADYHYGGKKGKTREVTLNSQTEN